MAAVRAAGKEVYAHVDNVLTMRGLALAAGASPHQRHAHGDHHDQRHRRRVALRAGPAGQDRREARFRHLRRVQERDGDLHAQRPQPARPSG